MRAILVVLILVISPVNVAGFENISDEIEYIIEDEMILPTYSKSIQAAFSRVSNIDQYSQESLFETKEWLVVTKYSQSYHKVIAPSLLNSEEVSFLSGSYIWHFNENKKVIDELEELLEYGEIESFSPLIEKNQNARYVPNDPNFDDQWHLQNTGQTGGLSGEDANVTGVWDIYNGSGIVISVVDDGLDHGHPDIEPHYSSAYSFDWCNNDGDPSPDSGNNGHGTAAGGVAAAVGDNGINVAGSAYGATIAGSTLIACGTSDQLEANALGFESNNIDIYTNSWGPSDDGQTLAGPGPITLAALENGAFNGRSGLGNIYTWAAGNGLESNDNANYDGYANSRYTIAVTAITHQGEQSYYAEPGANILIAAHSNGDGEGITTTDIEGPGGYDSGDITHDFGGTSSATPLAAGVIALILDANGNLTWRDIQHILVQSSRTNDANDSSWELNGAGHSVSHKYGFGAIDAGAAVSLAENWTNVEPESNASFGPFGVGTTIPDNSETWTEFTVNVSEDIRIESIDLITDITHTSRGDLDIVLVSPSGKESWLAETRDDTGNGYSDWLFNTVHHWDEAAVGNWTLKIRDTIGNDEGMLNYWEMIIHGIGNFTDTDGDGISDFVDTDDDGDGWSDLEEESCGTDALDINSEPLDTDSDGICNILDLDDDGDGWSDLEEESCSTDTLDINSEPLDTDSDGICNILDLDDDGDGWSDLEENNCNTSSINNTSIPLDTDLDGICNFIDTDDDGDGLSDSNETEIYGTDPYDPDMDDDGLTDYEEVMIYGTKADQMDTDSDGLSDYQEVITYGTNPLDEDSDNDGLLDIEELNTWNTDPNSFDKDEDEDTFYHFQDCNDTNPNINPGSMESLNNIDDNCDNLIDEGFNETDIDNDGLFDWNEYHMYGTNFTNNDTDNDGLSDSYEIYISGTNPLIPDLDNDGDGWYWFEDCNDQESNIYPDMNEILDNIDNDCDESVDEDFVAIDTDLDGLTDYEEYHNYSTDPLDGDSDDDGLSDGLEVNSFDSDPLQTDLDRDHDGWYEFQDCDDNDFDRAPDKLEQLDNKDNDCDGIVDEDYWSLDSDYDGISDYSEYHNYTTDPHNDDSDSDGMTDSFEILVSFSDPNKYDYDNDYDGFYGFEDCNDLVFSINSGVVEIWNGMDDNCNNVVDENIERISIISSNPAFGEEYYWDSANKSLIITLEGVPGNIARTITWEFEGFSITENTSSDNSRLFLPPLDCNDIYRTDLATHLCLEGDKKQNITVTIEDLGVITELKWDVETDVWIRNSNQENSAISFISGTFGIIMIISFVIIVSAIGVAVGLRIENNKNLKDAYDAFGVSNMSKTSNQNIVLPAAPEIIDSEK